MFRLSKKPQCRRIKGLLSEYIDNRLDGKKKALVEQHLMSCDACSKELESLRLTVQLLHRVPQAPLPRSFTITLPEPKREAVLGPSSLRWLRLATAAAAIVLLVLLVGDFLNIFGQEIGTRGGELLTEPPQQTTIFSGLHSEGNLTDSGGNETLKITAPPTPEDTGNITEGNVSLIEGGFTASGPRGEAGPPSMPGKEAGGWPLRQIEIAIGVIVFVLASLTLFALRQRRREASIN